MHAEIWGFDSLTLRSGCEKRKWGVTREVNELWVGRKGGVWKQWLKSFNARSSQQQISSLFQDFLII